MITSLNAQHRSLINYWISEIKEDKASFGFTDLKKQKAQVVETLKEELDSSFEEDFSKNSILEELERLGCLE